MIRKTLAIVLGLAAALMLVVTLTAPMIAATTPAILTVALAGAAFLAWPRKRKVEVQS
jgi:threonine/homoserine/homoserine lactone efflux protein